MSELDIPKLLSDMEDFSAKDHEDAYDIVQAYRADVRAIYWMLRKLSELELPEVTKIMDDAGVVL